MRFGRRRLICFAMAGSILVAAVIGFAGPLAMGWILDLAGGMSPVAWGLAFAMVATSLIVFLIMRPGGLVGDTN